MTVHIAQYSSEEQSRYTQLSTHPSLFMLYSYAVMKLLVNMSVTHNSKCKSNYPNSVHTPLVYTVPLKP